MKKWKQIPKDVVLWKNEIDKIMFVDENNTATLKHIAKKIKDNQPIEKIERFFTLTGCVIDEPNYLKLKEEFEFVKLKYWENAEFYYKKREKNCKVCFHSREIRRKQNAFSMPDRTYNSFLQDLSNIIQKIDFKIIPIHIDLKKLLEEKIEEEVYANAFNKLIIKFYEELKTKQKGIVVLEARGKKEDRCLHKYAVELIEKNYENKIKGVYFNSKWNKEKSVTYSGLELADLCTYPIHKNIRSGKEDLAYRILKSKIIGFKQSKGKH